MLLINVEINAEEAIRGLDLTKLEIQNSLFAALVKSTALAREAVIMNIREGMKEDIGWPPFSPATMARKSKRGRSLMGLVDTGRMMTSVHDEVDKGRLEGKVFPGVDYLVYHEMGTRRMPARETFQPAGKKVSAAIEEIFKEEIARALA
jgi:HK97 gp10 family phage protein